MVAAGTGVRFGGDVPKALREIHGAPLVRHAVQSLIDGGVERVVVIIARGLEADFTAALAGLDIDWQLAYGGAERQESVRNGLAALRSARLSGDAIVLIHDAARPFMPGAVVGAVAGAVQHGAACAVPVVPIADTIRQVTADGSQVVDRADLRGVQTPQGARLQDFWRAHAAAQAAELVVTDDASVCEAAGMRVHLVPGSLLGRKITSRVDYVIAEALYAASIGEHHLALEP